MATDERSLRNRRSWIIGICVGCVLVATTAAVAILVVLRASRANALDKIISFGAIAIPESSLTPYGYTTTWPPKTWVQQIASWINPLHGVAGVDARELVLAEHHWAELVSAADVQFFDASHSNITCSAVESLCDSQQLKYLYLQGTKVTPQCLKIAFSNRNMPVCGLDKNTAMQLDSSTRRQIDVMAVSGQFSAEEKTKIERMYSRVVYTEGQIE